MGKRKKEEKEQAREPAKVEEPPKEGLLGWMEAILIAVLFLQFANTFVIQTFYIPSGSMEDTLLIGDRLFVNRFATGGAPTGLERALLPIKEIERGNILVFRSPEANGLDLVKRCVAVPGDRVELRNEQLYVNGDPVPEPYASYRKGGVVPDLPARVVPDDRYLCLGDNRDNSLDSRFWGWVPRSHVKGQALMIYWSYGGETPDGGDRDTWTAIRQTLATLVGMPTRSRWERSFRLIR